MRGAGVPSVSIRDEFERFIQRSIETEPHDHVLTTEGGGRFLILILPLPDTKSNEKDVEGFDLLWKKRFIEWLLKGRSIRQAAQLSGISRRQAYRQKESDEVFRNAWELARHRNEQKKAKPSS